MLTEEAKEDFGLVQLLSLTLSILILIGLAVEALVPLSVPATQALDQIDFIVCVFFMVDFFHRFFRAPSKLKFLKWGWIDFISSLPVVGILQVGRIARILRILRVLRIFRSTRTIWTHVARNRPRATLKGAVVLAIITYILGCIAILEFEAVPNANIRTPGDAYWWSFSTMITVGCDKFPVTPAGRFTGALLSLVGAGLTGVYTAYVASFFIRGSSSSSAQEELLAEIRGLRSDLSRPKQT